MHNEKNGSVNMTAMERQAPDFIRSRLQGRRGAGGEEEKTIERKERENKASEEVLGR